MQATIELARLIRARQPKLFDYALGMRNKRAVLEQLDIAEMTPVLHVSGMFGGARHNLALVSPVAQHPVNKNEIICFDLAAEPSMLADLDEDTLRQRLFAPWSELPEGVERPGIKGIHINRSPVVATPKLLDSATAERLGVDVQECYKRREELRAIPGLVDKLHALYQGRELPSITDPDRMLYSGGFFSDADKRIMEQVRDSSPDELREQAFPFEDARLPEMLFRYRARNFPDSPE